MKKKIALIFGGRSLESDISVITALQALYCVDTSKYVVEPLYLYEGDFYVDGVDRIESFVNFNVAEHKRCILSKGVFYTVKRNKLYRRFKPDCALVCCHGGEGENGVLQALLEFNGIPYTCCGVLQSACGMDKTLLKRIFVSMGLDVAPYCMLQKADFESNRQQSVRFIEKTLQYPLIIKPSSQGSSIGISVANDEDELIYALKVAFSFDSNAIVEHKLQNVVEVNCAAVKTTDGINVSMTEQPEFDNAYLTFDDKYLSGGKMSANTHVMPAKISDLNEKVKQITLEIYKTLALKGVVRVDFLVDTESKTVYVNEINTVPGSLAFYLFEKGGLSFEKLIEQMIEYATSAGIEYRKTYKSNVLTNFKNGRKINK